MTRFLTRGAASPALVASALLLLNGCSGVKVYQRAVLERPPGREAADAATGPNAGPADLLRAGMALERSDPGRAIACYREAALKALPALTARGVTTEPDFGSAEPADTQTVYGRAVEYAVLAAHRVAKREGLLWTEVLARRGVVVRGAVNGHAPGGWGEALPARCFAVEGFHRSASRGGLGAPLVLGRTRPEDPGPADQYFPPILYKGVTAVLRPSGAADGPPAVLELHDPVREPDMLWPAPGAAVAAGPVARPLPMAYDLTTPLGRQFAVEKLDLIGSLGLLFPFEFDEETGIYMFDRYEPGKIPVVFVHGINSSPQAWANALNELRGDPELRKRYQFWLFFYSSGNPILLAGARLRAALTEARREFDPDGRDPALDRTVLIGHSMGGLLSRLSVSASGSTVWDAASRVPPERVNLAPDLKAKLLAGFFFEPVPSVARVVFLATPHRGSPLGYKFVGKLVSSLILLPRTMQDVSKALIQANGSLAISPAFRDRRQMTSVAQLAPDNTVLKVINGLPIAPGVPYHSIIGFDGEGDLARDGGDGVVPYSSAHIEGALSELVVTSNHSVQETDKALVEMRRILRVHLSEYDADRRALSLGLSPPRRATRPEGPTPVRFDLIPPPTDDTRPAIPGTPRALRIVR